MESTTDGVEHGLIAPHGGRLNPREVTGDAARLIRRRESYEDLMRNFEGL